jgi:hypothetical protein
VGFWVKKPFLVPGEEIVWQSLANHQQGHRAIGGKLLLTSERVIFQPHRLDTATGGQPWSCGRGSVVEVNVIDPPAGSILSGGRRRSLGIETRERVEMFFVTQVELKLAVLKSSLKAPGDNDTVT